MTTVSSGHMGAAHYMDRTNANEDTSHARVNRWKTRSMVAIERNRHQDARPRHPFVELCRLRPTHWPKRILNAWKRICLKNTPYCWKKASAGPVPRNFFWTGGSWKSSPPPRPGQPHVRTLLWIQFRIHCATYVWWGLVGTKEPRFSCMCHTRSNLAPPCTFVLQNPKDLHGPCPSNVASSPCGETTNLFDTCCLEHPPPPISKMGKCASALNSVTSLANRVGGLRPYDNCCSCYVQCIWFRSPMPKPCVCEARITGRRALCGSWNFGCFVLVVSPLFLVS